LLVLNHRIRIGDDPLSSPPKHGVGDAAEVAWPTIWRRGAEPAHPAVRFVFLAEARPSPKLALTTARAPAAGHALGVQGG
jgi:hypothetical protein